ncbi:cytochrome P450 [Sphaerisporangium sp. TRM90804]|uniref:cytochrome P450 family protein n=1 Tax=Sphaerisporangium sp. TRM90804 TaxID=3031113 RepID=UPI00244C21B7|nr:cytochrome P450 [Sphaerisporangium sp. TRM90804]MDH2424428.1 cytochrome P450 [Sphaerisporangium sp. TRM90804]
MSTSADDGTATGLPTVDFMDPELLRDPFNGYSRIRERSPLALVRLYGENQTALLVTRYDDVKTVLSDTRFVNDPAGVPGMEVGNIRDQLIAARGIEPEYAKYVVEGLLDADGAEHVRLRRLVSRAFTARRVADLRPRVEAITERLLDELGAAAEDGVVDLIRHFAYPLPITVICELVGIPEEDRGQWREWGGRLASMTSDLNGPLRDMVAHIQELIERRRATPADDLLTGLIRAHDEDGDRLGDIEMITMVLTLVLAGHETTAHLIGNGTAALLTHPDQLDLLRKDPALTPRAVHELMRWCGPVHVTRIRYAAEEIQIGEHTLRRGDAVMAVLVGANYDPRRFDDPETLDITREADAGHKETHVGFGAGLHYCLGAALARQEGEVAFGALLRRFPGLSLAVDPAELEREMVPGSWRLARLPVRL